MKKQIVVTNGCFDLLHKGHISYLTKAKSLGTYLIVLLNSDNSIKQLKGNTRPIINQEDRKFMLQNLKAVDEVIIFDDITCQKELAQIKPDIYCKAADYNIDSLNKKELEVLQNYKTKIVFLDFVDNISTTTIINKIKETF